MELMMQEEGRTTRKVDEIPTILTNQNSSLPLPFLRVLLVESDASTRQIIAALLRRCGYSVTAVPDGLKAWETLNGRPHDINIVLTEVELPSISGFALLTLIMEHEICKKIPVIMMSSQDSVNMVFKCMLRGAADFLIKPVRKNELRNLWQHVWRRQSSSGGGGCPFQKGNVEERKSEAISENNAASNHSSDYVGCRQKNEDFSEKGSDAQSSCTKAVVEAESAYLQNFQDLLQSNSTSLSPASHLKIWKPEESVKLDENMLICLSEVEDKSIIMGSEVAPCNEYHTSTETMTQVKDVSLDSHKERVNISNGTHGDYYEQGKSFGEAIDLIGSFDKHSRYTYGLTYNTVCLEDSPNDMKNSSSLLELSLRRPHPSDNENQGADEKHFLKHSDVSAFSRYTNRTIQSHCPASADFSPGTNQSACNSQNAIDVPKWNGSILKNNQENGPADSSLPCPQIGVVHVPVPVRGIMFDGFCSGYGPTYHALADPPPVCNSNSTTPKEPNFLLNSSHPSNLETHDTKQVYYPYNQNSSSSTNQTVHEQQEQKSAYMENPRHVSSATILSASSSVCNGSTSHPNSTGSERNCNGSSVKVTPAFVAKNTAESGNDGVCLNDGIRGTDFHRSTQREEALNKFRLKRKERCFEKKVRYHSRKRLAEQRPRVKGQFVRQVQADPASTETELV